MSETGRQYFPEPTSTSVTASGAGAAPEEKKCTCPTKMWCGDEMNESTCVLTEEEHRALRSIPDEETCANCGKIYGEHLLWDGNKCEPGGVAGWFPSKVAHAIERSRLDFCACTGPGQCAAGSAKFRCRSDADIPYALAKQASSPAPVAPAAEEIEYIDACDPHEPGYRGTRSLESRLALAVNEAHYYLCCVKEGIAERSPSWSIRLRDRLGAILEEAERARLLEGAEEDKLPMEPESKVAPEAISATIPDEWKDALTPGRHSFVETATTHVMRRSDTGMWIQSVTVFKVLHMAASELLAARQQLAALKKSHADLMRALELSAMSGEPVRGEQELWSVWVRRVEVWTEGCAALARAREVQK